MKNLGKCKEDFENGKCKTMKDLFKDIIVALISSVVDAMFPLLREKKALKNEKKIIREERNEKLKPVLINYTSAFESEEKTMPKYIFESDGPKVDINIKGIFKNTNCGITFLEKIVTETKTYLPKYNSTIDTNTAFVVELHNRAGETLKFCQIFCHDILGNDYYYDAKIVYRADGNPKIEIGNIHKVVKTKNCFLQ